MSFNIDEKINSDGIEVKFEGSKFMVASTDNMKYQRLLSKLRYPYRYKIDKGTIDPSKMLDILCESISKTILLDWSNVKDDKGNEVEFSKEVAYKVLKDNGIFRSFIIDTATELENFKEETLTDDIKD